MSFLLDIPCNTTCEPEQVCVRGVCVNIGRLGINLVWSRVGDADLVVSTPNNNTIYYRNKGPSNATDGGYLDMDDQVGTGPENVFWPSNSTTLPPYGTFNFCVQVPKFNASISASRPLQVTIAIRQPMYPTYTYTKTFTRPFTDTNRCLTSSPGYIGSFIYP